MNVPCGLGFQVPFSERIRREADVMTQSVGAILDGHQAEAILQEGRADLVAVGRQALYDPYWAHHAAHSLGYDLRFGDWPIQHGRGSPSGHRSWNNSNSRTTMSGA